ncbi:MAG TPA: serine protease [Pseudorhodoplanes sp.]|nr:serine protease [Pseudorhodoplanes sp.]
MMRIAVVCAAWVIATLTWPANAQNSTDRAEPAAAAAKRAAKPAAPSTSKTPKAGETRPEDSAAPTNSKANEAIRAAYAAMPFAERLAIQSDLIWSKDYNGGITGDFNDRSIAAVKAFQKRSKAAETGILTPEQRTALAATVKGLQEHVGWRLVDDANIPGVRLGVPGKLAPQEGRSATGSRWASARGEVQIETFRIGPPNSDLAAQFDKQKKNPVGRRTEYSVLRTDFFVVSGLQGLKKFYVRAQQKGPEIRGVTILYDQAMEGIMEPVVVAMSSAFSPFDNAVNPLAKRKVEYSTGILVSAAGHLIADRQATEGCDVVTVSGRGHAERVAEDAASDMALLRIYGVAPGRPAPLSTEAPKGEDLTLVGVADPQLQNGDGAVTTMKGRLAGISGPMVAVEPVPATGFSGGAALDGQGQLVGMIELKPQSGSAAQAALVPTATIRAFLEKERVAPAVGRMSLDDAKAAVARVICFRK